MYTLAYTLTSLAQLTDHGIVEAQNICTRGTERAIYYIHNGIRIIYYYYYYLYLPSIVRR